MINNLPNNDEKGVKQKEEKEKKESFLSKFPFFKKIKSIKNIEIVIAVLIICVMLLIYFSSFGASKSSSSSGSINDIKYTNAESYAKDLEERIGNTLSKISGAGEVSVVITLSSSSEFIIAKDVEQTTHTESITENGVTTKTEEIVVIEKPLLIDGSSGEEPLVLLEIMPKIAGVVVVAEGAKDVNVKLNLLKAIQALITVPSGNIEILY